MSADGAAPRGSDASGLVRRVHGAGGQESAALIAEVFSRRLGNDVLDRMEDAAVLPPLTAGAAPVVTTDAFVVTPYRFKGGDIGRLAVCGTVNDLLMMGAEPSSLTAAFILEEGLPVDDLAAVVDSLAATAREAGVRVVAGDTKVIGVRGDAPGLYVSTSGLGVRASDAPAPTSSGARPGDVLLVSGPVGDHHACILAARSGMDLPVPSDCAPLVGPVRALLGSGADVRAMRDVTRGGLATIASEIAAASRCGLLFDEEAIPVRPEVRALCGLLGLDPLVMGCEGRFAAVVPEADEARALAALRADPLSAGAVRVGRFVAGAGVRMRTALGTVRFVEALSGEGLPRIC